jgi:serine/threonine-protein kinase
MIGESLAEYRILENLGKGGMGEVYLARDTNLDRKVAIKVLRADLVAKDNARRRLIREARAAAKLDHPNICSIYDVNETESRTFIVMQYVEGETLADKTDGKVLGLNDAVNIIRQTAEALAEAHSCGIIHRDIKPQNIMITPRNQVKILDFGLCKHVPSVGDVDNESPTVSMLSTPGGIIGTMPYMSPEQVQGEHVDGRSDIFSLGVTFYEVVAGVHPFKADSKAVTMSRILLADPFPSKRLQSLGCPELEQVFDKMLRKDKTERYQTAEELLTDLNKLPPFGKDETRAITTSRDEQFAHVQGRGGRWLVGKVARYKWAVLALLFVILAAVVIYQWLPSNRIESLAILPFTYSSSDPGLASSPDREYLSDGLTDSVINNLSQVPNLRVIARSSVFYYKGKKLDPQAAGRELGVRAVLTGNIAQEGDELTITASLMDVTENRSLGVYTYKRKKADIQSVQIEIARDISEKLRLKLSGAVQTSLAKTYTENSEAYEAYLKGRYHWNKRTDEGFKQATKFFQEAIVKDPEYARAYTGLADCYTLRSDYGFLAPTEGYALAKGAVTLALKFDDSLAEAHTSLASIKAVTDWDWQGAENEYRRAIELNPNYATAHHWYAVQLLVEGKLDQALLEIRRAQQLDPLSLGINKDFAVILLYTRDYDKALAQCRKTLEIEPNFLVMSTYIAQIYELKQNYAEATAELEKAHAAAPNDGEISYGLAQAYTLSGRRAEALRIVSELQQGSTYLPKEAAYLWFLLGEKDKAIAILQKAAADRYLAVAETKMDPRFGELRTDPRLVELLHRIGLQ